jgi:hypothetical protein
MAIAETQQLRMLEQLRHAGEQPVTVAQLRAGGIDFPAVVIGDSHRRSGKSAARALVVWLRDVPSVVDPAGERERERRPGEADSDGCAERELVRDSAAADGGQRVAE